MTAPQRSPEWFAARAKRITASRVGAILGHSPFATPDDVMRTMVREALGAEREFTGNVATAWGNAMEANAIADFEMETGLSVEATGFHEYEDWAGVSPDGLIGRNCGIEQKCPYGLRNDPEPVFKPLKEQPHYYDQVQFTINCLNRDCWWFVQWTPHGSAREMVPHSKAWADTNMPILRQFYARFLSELESPDEHLAPLRTVIDTPAAALMVAEYDQLSEAISLAEERKKDLLAEMVALAGERNAVFGGRKLTQTTRAGSVSYGKALKELAPGADLSKWTGKPSSYWGLK